jgi:hypothetical protein
MSSTTSAANGRPTDESTAAALRDAADFCASRYDTAESGYFRSLADRIGTDKALADETLYRALRDGGAMFHRYAETDKGARLKQLAAQLGEANPKAMPSTKSAWKDTTTADSEGQVVEAA